MARRELFEEGRRRRGKEASSALIVPEGALPTSGETSLRLGRRTKLHGVFREPENPCPVPSLRAIFGVLAKDEHDVRSLRTLLILETCYPTPFLLDRALRGLLSERQAVPQSQTREETQTKIEKSYAAISCNETCLFRSNFRKQSLRFYRRRLARETRFFREAFRLFARFDFNTNRDLMRLSLERAWSARDIGCKSNVAMQGNVCSRKLSNN